MQNDALCNRYVFALILGEGTHRFLTTSTEGRSGYTVKKLSVVAKTMRVMQLTAILLTVCCLSVTARTVSQTVTYTGKGVRLETVFAAIKEQTGYFVLFEKGLASDGKPLSVNAKDMSLKDFLDEILKGQPFTYSLKKTTITIARKMQAADLSPRLISPSLSIPPITVRGKILNENNEPVVASIIIKGTNRGVNTDASGNFEINNVDDKAVLIISAANIQTREISAANIGNGFITVSTLLNPLDEVVFKGYYAESKRLSTGSVSTVKSEDIAKQPVGNVMSAIQGRMAGVFVQQRGGTAGSSFNIQIRGRNSLRENGMDPLYVIDGVPYSANFGEIGFAILAGGVSPLNSIDISSIERIEILKDADATSIYGSRGANGVVLITTKAGKAGKTSVTANVYHGSGKVSGNMKLLNNEQYLMMRHEALANDGKTIQSYDSDLNGDWDTTRYTDWQKELIGGSSAITSAQISVSGGSSSTQFLLTTVYLNEGTVFPGNFHSNRFSTNFSANHLSENKRFKLNFKVGLSVNDSKLPTKDLTDDVVRLPPVAPALYDENGMLNWQNSTWDNPLFSTVSNYTNKINTVIANIGASYNILRNLIIKTNIGYTHSSGRDFNATKIAAQNPAYNPAGLSLFGSYDVKTIIVEPQAEYKLRIKNSSFSFLAGGTYQRDVNNRELIYGFGYTSDALLNNLGAAGSIYLSNYSEKYYRYIAGFGRFNYNLNNKYIINATFRRDGSSRFGPGKQFANFGAVGASWLFSEEDFIKNNSVINFGKLHASYGSTGNDKIADYGYFDAYAAVYNQYDGPGLVPARLANPDYRWETNKKLEAGIEIIFFKNIFNLSATWYTNRSSNQLVGYNLSTVTGASSIQYNFPATVQNTGLELVLSTKNISTKNINWSSSINVTVPKNKLVKFRNLKNDNYYSSQFVVGEPITLVKSYQINRVNPSTGLYDIQDFNNDGRISYEADRMIYNNIGQRLFGGLHNSITYENFALDFLFQFSIQKGMNYLKGFQIPGSRNTQPVEILQRWTTDKVDAPIQRFSTGGDASGDVSSYTAWSNVFNYGNIAISDASFVRLKNVHLSYNIPFELLRKTAFNNIKLYVQGQNLLTFTKYKGLDPETLSFQYIPVLRVVTVGVQIGL